jgi:gliding motility-associated-like protein
LSLILKTNLRHVFTITMLFFSFCAIGQQGYWQVETSQKTTQKSTLQALDKDKFLVYSLQQKTLQNLLTTAPLRTKSGKTSNVTMVFPDDKGNIQEFAIVETPVLSPALAQKYPTIKSYKGYAVNGSGASVRFSMSNKGMQAVIFYADKEPVFIEKLSKNEASYAVFRRSSRTQDFKTEFICDTEASREIDKVKSSGITQRDNDDQNLRSYRLAVSASGEYTQYHGGTVNDALDAINATLTRINAIYERDLGITLQLISNTDEVIYTDSTTDPYNGNLTGELQTNLDNVIGAANYDIGHLFHRATSNGNAGFIAGVCVDGQKGSAFSASLTPEGDVYDIDLVAHEMGHQFGGRHTQTNSCARDTAQGTNIEVGSGSTIMGYAGICDPNVQNNSDPYFDYVNIQNITDNIQVGTGASCAQLIPLANNPPTVDGGADYIIPRETPFVLTANGTDMDGDPITYTWEQIDTGFSGNNPPQATNTSGPLFRSLQPTAESMRYFPQLTDVLSGDLGSTWEVLPNVGREMNFAVTVRDNVLGGGQTSSDVIQIQVASESGPFRVISQNNNVTYEGGSVQTVVWDAAYTNVAPINAAEVDILLSDDGGATFAHTLVQNTPNDGSQQVIIPGGIATTNARILIRASNNIFYAVNDSDFTITTSPFVMNFQQLYVSACQPNDVVANFTYNSYNGFNEEVTFSASNVPAGLTTTFNPTSATANATTVQLTVSGTPSVAAGVYPITVTGTSVSETRSIELDIAILNNTFTDVVLSIPTDGDDTVFFNQVLSWELHSNAESYDVQLSTDSNFATLVASATVETNSFKPPTLQPETTYYWRVKPKNQCGEGNFSAAFTFTTFAVNCMMVSATDNPQTISDGAPSIVSSTILISESAPIADINVTVGITHSYVSDITVRLTSPSGTSILLVSEACNSSNNIQAVFDDDGNQLNCSTNPAISGFVVPMQPLSTFFGENSAGVWTLEVEDNFDQDGGSLDEFGLELCLAGDVDSDGDGFFDSVDNCPDIPNSDQADLDGDGVGDVCDDDIDGDTIANNVDNCMLVYNPQQLDIDQDGEGDACDEDVLVPQAFTPNGDGINDTWTILNIDLHPNTLVTVYNRWGKQVYKAKGYQNNWDGIHQGQNKRVPAGSYYYQIDLEADGKIDFKGWLYITY